MAFYTPEPASMMQEVLAKLTRCEREKVKAELEAKAMGREGEAKVMQTSEELLELKRTQDQEMRVFRVQNEKRVRDASFTTQNKIHHARKKSAEAVALAEAAEFRQKTAEAHVANLEQKVLDLQAMVDKRAKASKTECHHVQRMMDGRYERVAAQADGRIRSMAEHAKEVCSATGAALETVGYELQDQMIRASVRAEGRIRFKELCELAKSLDGVALTKDTYNDVKGNLIDLWHTQSKPPNVMDYPEDFLSSGAASPTGLNLTKKTIFSSAGGESLSGTTQKTEQKELGDTDSMQPKTNV